MLGRAARSGFWKDYSSGDKKAAFDAMEKTGILHLAGRSVNALSSGEKQLVFIAQALAQEAGLLLFDEPTAHLDLRYKTCVIGRMKALAAEGFGVLAVLHEPALAGGCNKALLFKNDGKYIYGTAGDCLKPGILSEIYGVPADSSLLNV